MLYINIIKMEILRSDIFMNNKQWFVYSNEDGMSFYTTKREAKEEYEKAKKLYYDNLDYWEEDDIIVWGDVNSITIANEEELYPYAETNYNN